MTHGIVRVVVVLSVALLVQAGVTAAATNTPGANSSEALKGRVVIECKGHVGKRPARPPIGRCTIYGAITDRGRFVDDDVLRHNPHGRAFLGAKGTIEFSVYRERRGHWRIIKGTQSYAGLRGRGWEASTRLCAGPFGCTISLTMTGNVSQSTGTSGASASGAIQGKVWIHAVGTRLGPDQAAEGRFTIYGAIIDKGSFVDNIRLNVGYVRTFFGAKGTIEIFAGRPPKWSIIKGTRAYAGLRGWGIERRLYTPTSIDATMIGTVWR